MSGAPNEFSWRWGIEDDPGHQGYHGLKEAVPAKFIALGRPKFTITGSTTAISPTRTRTGSTTATQPVSPCKSVSIVGFIAENVYLFCASEGLATVVRALIPKEALAKTLKLRESQVIVLAQTVGVPKQ